MGAAANGPLVIIGDKLGLFESLANNGAMTPDQLASDTGTAERYVKE